MAGLAALAVLAWILIQAPTAEAATGTITVTVQDYHGNPLPDAYVCLLNSTGYFESKTDGNGRATFSDMKLDDAYRLNVTYLGIKDLRVFENWNYSNPAHPKTLRTGVFNVKICVKSSGGIQPIPGARVEIRSDQTKPHLNREQTTGSDGCAIFPRLPGNGTQYRYNATFNHQLFGVQITSDEASLNLDVNNYESSVVELPLYRLRLTLRDRADRPVQGLEVMLWREEKTGQPQMTATSDSAGQVAFNLLPAGRYIYEVMYKGEAIYTVSPPERVDSNRDRGPIRLPLTRLVVEVYDLKNKPLTTYTRSYELSAKMFVDSRLYHESKEAGGVLNMGLVYDERDYRLILQFEGQEVASTVLSSTDIKAGTLKVRARFGDFTVAIDSSGFFGALSKIVNQRSSIRLTAGNYQVLENFGGGGTVTLRDQPLIRYTYSIMLDGVEIGSGEMTPQHGESSQVRPSSHEVSLRAVSLDDRPVEGVLRLSYGGESLGTVNIPRDGGRVEGLLRLNYRYFFTYMGVEVAAGELKSSEVQAGVFDIRAGVADVRAVIYDNSGEELLRGAVASLTIASYKRDSVVNEDGVAFFPDAPLSTGTLTVNYQGVKVYSSPVTYSPETRTLEIRNTGVFKMTFRVLDGEGEPLSDAEFRMSVGTLSITETLRQSNELALKLVPNGTITLSVNYMGVNVFSGSHRPLRDGDVVEIAAKVYRLQAEVFGRGRDGRVPLRGSQLLLEREGARLAVLDAPGGAAAVKLPAGNYLVVVSYKGAAVADRVLSLTGSQKIAIEASVYEFAVKVLYLDGSPAENLSVKLSREGSDAYSEELLTDGEGRASSLLPEGIYNVAYGRDDVFRSVRLPVKAVTSWTLLYGENQLNSFFPLIATPALAALSIYGLYNSFRLKSRVRRIRAVKQEKRGAAEWERRRERLRKNV